jgi:hypothetical protein
VRKTKFAVDTKVPVVQTRMEIESTLTRYGATSFAFATHQDRATVMFEAQKRRVRFELKLPSAGEQRATAKLHRERWRALFLAIKAKLVSVDTEIESFEEAFMSHIVLADGSTVGDSVKPALIEQYATGKMTPLLGPPTSGG